MPLSRAELPCLAAALRDYRHIIQHLTNLTETDAVCLRVVGWDDVRVGLTPRTAECPPDIIEIPTAALRYLKHHFNPCNPPRVGHCYHELAAAVDECDALTPDQKKPLFTVLTYMDGPHALLQGLGNAAIRFKLCEALAEAAEALDGTANDTPPMPRSLLLPVEALVDALGLPAEKDDAVKAFLRRQHEGKDGKGGNTALRTNIEFSRKGEPQYVWRVRLVWPLLLEMLPQWK
jgi:hypothetical protein